MQLPYSNVSLSCSKAVEAQQINRTMLNLQHIVGLGYVGCKLITTNYTLFWKGDSSTNFAVALHIKST